MEIAEQMLSEIFDSFSNPNEILCAILELLNSPCCCSLALAEPLWMTLCLKGVSGLLEYRGTWKKNALHKRRSLYMEQIRLVIRFSVLTCIMLLNYLMSFAHLHGRIVQLGSTSILLSLGLSNSKQPPQTEKQPQTKPDQVVNANGPAFGCVQMKDYHKALAKRLKHNNTAYENYHRIFVPEGHPLKAEPREPLRANVMFKLIQKMLSGETAVIAETGLVFNCQKLKLPKGWCKQLSECD